MDRMMGYHAVSNIMVFLINSALYSRWRTDRSPFLAFPPIPLGMGRPVLPPYRGTVRRARMLPLEYMARSVMEKFEPSNGVESSRDDALGSRRASISRCAGEHPAHASSLLDQSSERNHSSPSLNTCRPGSVTAPRVQPRRSAGRARGGAGAARGRGARLGGPSGIFCPRTDRVSPARCLPGFSSGQEIRPARDVCISTEGL